MTISIVQTANFNGAWSGSFGSNVAAGNTVILIAFSYNQTAMSSSSPEFNGAGPAGAVQLYGLQSRDGGVYSTAWMLPDLAGGAASVSLTSINGTVNGNVGMAALEVAGLGASPALDSGATPNPSTGFSAIGAGTADSGATGDITSAPELIIAGAIGYGQNPGTPSPWTTLQPSGFCTAAWQIATSSGAPYEFTGNSMSVNWCAGIAAVQAGGGGGNVTGTLGPALAPLAASVHGAETIAGHLGAALAADALAATGHETGSNVTGTLGPVLAPLAARLAQGGGRDANTLFLSGTL